MIPECRNCHNPRSPAEASTYGSICENCWVKATGDAQYGKPRFSVFDLRGQPQRSLEMAQEKR